MSFTNALPANIPKLCGVILPPTTIASFDSAIGEDLVYARGTVLNVFDRGVGRERGILQLPDPLRALLGCIETMNTYYSELDINKPVKAEHFNVIPQCAIYGLSLVSYMITELAKAGIIIDEEISNTITKCWGLITSWMRVRSLDIILPEHENKLIDIAVCFKEISTLLKKIKF